MIMMLLGNKEPHIILALTLAQTSPYFTSGHRLLIFSAHKRFWYAIGKHTGNKERITKNITPIEAKRLENNVLKKTTGCYGHENAKITENGTTIENKRLLEDLFHKRNNYELDL